MLGLEGDVCCYQPAESEVDGSWVRLETFVHLGGAERDYVCLLSDMRKCRLRWHDGRFLSVLGAGCYGGVVDGVISVLVK